MTRRVKTLHRAVPEALCYLNGEDAAELDVQAGDTIRIESRRGSLEIKVGPTDCRFFCPRGYLWVPFFDADRLINKVTLGALDPQSNEPDYKKCAVRLSKVNA